jgi:hypothetical protein
MPKKLTTEDFIKKAREIHGDKYDYSLTEYINTDVKVKIICIDHGIFEQAPTNHISGKECKFCAKSKSFYLKQNNFIKKSKEIHGDKYDYSLVDYNGAKNKIKIICDEHGIFKQAPEAHLLKRGCPKCAIANRADSSRLTIEEFIKKSKEIHGDKFDYSSSEYTNNHTRIKIICKEHGIFEQTPTTHIGGGGCKLCANIALRNARISTKELFVEKAIKVHGYKFDYSDVNYHGEKIKVNIKCLKCNKEFVQTPSSHLYGNNFGRDGCGCPNCAKNKKLTAKTFVEKAIKVHGNKFNYNLVEYKASKEKVKIICKKHGVFEQAPQKHLQNRGCPKCAIENNADNKRFTEEEFIDKSQKVHEYKYDYSKVKYVTSQIKVKIICNKHGMFEQLPNSHLRGTGCPKCSWNSSKGEKRIEKYLIKNNIKYKTQFKSKHCVYKQQLPFDFIIKNKQKYLIEFQGHYHYSPNIMIKNTIKRKSEFEKQIKKDLIKKQYCQKYNITLIEIPYWEFNRIEERFDCLFNNKEYIFDKNIPEIVEKYSNIRNNIIENLK